MEELIKLINQKYGIPDKNIHLIGVSTDKPEYGEIKIIKIILDESDKHQLIMIPGYSTKSFLTMVPKLLDGLDHLKQQYSELLLLCWSPEIKTESEQPEVKIREENKGLSEKELIEKIYEANDEFKIEVAKLTSKILKKPDIVNKPFCIVAKSAGGGVTTYMAPMLENVHQLYLCCPGVTAGFKPLEGKDVKVKLAWNRDDDRIPYETYRKLLADLDEQRKEYEFVLYNEGGHELNTKFIYHFK